MHDGGHVVVNQLTGHEVKRCENHFQGADEIRGDFDDILSLIGDLVKRSPWSMPACRDTTNDNLMSNKGSHNLTRSISAIPFENFPLTQNVENALGNVAEQR
jgi:hypothetical protein